MGRVEAAALGQPQTGDSPEFWARAMGWYMMALVDTLDYFRRTTPAARS